MVKENNKIEWKPKWAAKDMTAERLQKGIRDKGGYDHKGQIFILLQMAFFPFMI
jgi:hypothetical protein